MSFYLRLIILSVSLTMITYVTQQYSGLTFINAFAYSSILFFAIITAVIYAVASRSISGKNHRMFSTAVMGSMTIKLFASVLFVLFYSLIQKPPSVLIILPFFLFYICYTVIEISAFIQLNKKVK